MRLRLGNRQKEEGLARRDSDGGDTSKKGMEFHLEKRDTRLEAWLDEEL